MLTDEMRADGWIEHDGDAHYPVPPDTVVTVLRANGSRRRSYADRFRWSHLFAPKGSEIIAYRLENPHD